VPEKKVSVTVEQKSGFRTECEAGRHRIVIDQPAAAGGSDAGPTPLDVQLMALGACIAAISRIVANQKRLPLKGVKVAVEGTLDTDALLGKQTGVRAGFSSISARVFLDADLSREQKEEFVRLVDSRCPVSDNLHNPTPVSVTLG